MRESCCIIFGSVGDIRKKEISVKIENLMDKNKKNSWGRMGETIIGK